MEKFNSNVDSKSQQENIKTINGLITTMKLNPKFNQLINYSLTTLKSIITIQEKHNIDLLCTLLLKKELLTILTNIFNIHKDNEEVVTKLGELLFCLIKIYQTGMKEKESKLKKSCNDIEITKTDLFSITLNFMESLSSNHEDSHHIFIKILQNLSSDSIVDDSKDLKSIFHVSLDLLNRFDNNLSIVLYTMETIKKLVFMENFKLEPEDQNKLIQTINSIVIRNEKMSTASIGEAFQILRVLMQNSQESKEFFKQTKPISFILKVLAKSENDNSLSFYCIELLADVIEKEDISMLLKFLKASNNHDSISIEACSGILKEFQYSGLEELPNVPSTEQVVESSKSIEEEDKEGNEIDKENNKEGEQIEQKRRSLVLIDTISIINLRKNIARLLLMIARDYNFLKILGELNSIDILVDLIQSELNAFNNDKNASIVSARRSSFSAEPMKPESTLIHSILPNFLKLSFSLLNEFEAKENLSNEEGNNAEESNKLVKQVASCLLQSLSLVVSNKVSTMEIVNLLLASKSQSLLESICVDFFSYIKPVFINYYDEIKLILLIQKMNSIYSSLLKQNPQMTKLSLINLPEIQTELNENFDIIFEKKTEEPSIVCERIKECLLKMIYAMLIEGNFPENSYQEFFMFTIRFMNILNNEEVAVPEIKDDREILQFYTTFVIAALTNQKFGIFEQKLNFFTDILSFITLKSELCPILCIPTLKLIDFYLLPENKGFAKILLNHPQFISFIVVAIKYYVTEFSVGTKADIQPITDHLELILKTLLIFLKYANPISFGHFIREDGLVKIIEICGLRVYEFEVSKLINVILQKFSTEALFKVCTQYFKNYIYSSKLVASIKKISFSKGVNERIYIEILTFFKNVMKQCDIIEAIEEKLLIDHFIGEYDQIYAFYMDTSNKVFELIVEALASFSKEKKLKRQLINSSFFLKTSQLLKSVFLASSEVDDFNEKIIDHLSLIFIGYLKSKDYSKMLYETYYSVLEILKVIPLKVNLSENTFTRLITVYQYIIDIERNNSGFDYFTSSSTKLMTTTFFEELLTKTPEDNLKSIIKKCLSLIEDQQRRNTVLKHLPAKRATMSNHHKNSVISQGLQNLSTTNSFERLSLSQLEPIAKEIFSNFESCTQACLNMMESITENDNLNKEFESEEVSALLNDLIKMVEVVVAYTKHQKGILKKEGNTKLNTPQSLLKLLYDSEVVHKALYLLDDKESILKIVMISCSNFIISLEKLDSEMFYKNEKIIDFFVGNFKDIFKDLTQTNLNSSFSNSVSNNLVNTAILNKKAFIALKAIDNINVEVTVTNNKLNINSFLEIDLIDDIELAELLIEKLYNFLIKCSQLASNNSTQMYSNSDKNVRQSKVMDIVPTFNSNAGAVSSSSFMGCSLSTFAERLLIYMKKYIFTCHSNRIMTTLCNIILIFRKEETFIKELIAGGSHEMLVEVFKIEPENKDLEIYLSNIYTCMILYEILAQNKFICVKIVDQSSINSFNCLTERCFKIIKLASEQNSNSVSRNSKIDLKSNKSTEYNLNTIVYSENIITCIFKVFIQCSKVEKKYCTIMGIYGVKELIVSILGDLKKNEFTISHTNDLVEPSDKDFLTIILEFILVILCDEFNLNFFRDPSNIQLIVEFLKNHIKNKVRVLLILKIINLLTSNLNLNAVSFGNVVKASKQSTEDSKLTLKEALDPYKMIEIINDLLDNYSTVFEIGYQTCEFISQFLNINEDQMIKDFLVSIIVNNFEKYSTKLDTVEMFLDSLLTMLKQSRSISSKYDPTSIVFFISKVCSARDIKLNDSTYFLIFKLIKQIMKLHGIHLSVILELYKLIDCVERIQSLQNDQDIIIIYSRVHKIVCDVSNNLGIRVRLESVLFLIRQINKHLLFDKSKTIMPSTINLGYLFTLLDEYKSIIATLDFGKISDSQLIPLIEEMVIVYWKMTDIIKLFNKGRFDSNTSKSFNPLLEIMTFCSLHSELMKDKFLDSGLCEAIENLIDGGTENCSNSLLEYQSKALVASLRKKKTGISVISTEGSITSKTRSSVSTTLGFQDVSSILVSNLEEEIKKFLKEEREVKIYTEKGDIKKRFISFNDSLERITSFKKEGNKVEVLESMKIQEMDRCVRSCTTKAFSLSQGIFTKKPNAAKCFSILGKNSLNGQKTFNVECNKEEDCIKYVDSISMLIQNYLLVTSKNSLEGRTCSIKVSKP